MISQIHVISCQLLALNFLNMCTYIVSVSRCFIEVPDFHHASLWTKTYLVS